jgi:hypothetical protein
VFDRLRCEALMRDAAVDPYLSWACAQASDALRAQSRSGLEGRYCGVPDAQFKTVVNFVTLPNLHSDVQGLSYFSELSSLKDTTQYLLSKTLNQRCQSRKIGDVSMRCFDASPEIALQLKRIVLCALLGNYETSCATTRPRAECRARLYEIMYDRHAHFHGWFKSLLIDGSTIVLYCLREYLIFAIQDNPGMCAHLQELMRLAEFSAITAHAMNTIRAYVDRNLFEPLSLLSQSVCEGAERVALPWCAGLEAELANCQKAVLGISYRRPKRHLFQCFDTVRKKLSLVVNTRLAALVDSGAAHAAAEIASFASESGGDADAKQDASLSLFVSDVQLRELNALLSFILPYSCADVLKDFLPWLEHFGVSRAVIDYTLSLNMAVGTDEVLSDEKLRKRLLYLREHQPHAYNLIQVVTRMISDRQRIKTLSTLPLHYWRNQIEAIQGRFGVAGTECLLESMIYFVYCEVCGTVYSLLRDFHSVYKQSYTYGYRDAVVDYQTDDIYCKNDKSNHMGTCASAPLTYVLLLGQVIQYQNKTILLCPQLGCGMPMVLDPAYCAFNERGVACCDCTRSMHINRHLGRDRCSMETYVAPMDNFVTCELCFANLCKPSHMYWYPHNVIICKSHSNASIMKRFNDVYAHSGMARVDVINILRSVSSSSSRLVARRTKTYSSSKGRRGVYTPMK